MAQITTQITLNENEVLDAIKYWIVCNYDFKVETESIHVLTGTQGNHDEGTAREYIKSVTCLGQPNY